MLLAGPTPEQRSWIIKAHNENLETKDRDLQSVKDWLKKQPHLPDSWDEDCLKVFMRGCGYSVETCKRKLDMYFTVRTAFPEFFSNRDIRRKELQDICKVVDGAIMPNLSPSGERICICRPSKPEFETPNIANVIKIVFMVSDIRLKLEQEGIIGDVYVLDAGFPLAKHFLKVNPLLLKKMFICIQDAYPAVIKAIHIINAPPFVEFAMNVVRPFLNDTLKNVFHVHPGVETLYEYVPKEALPEDYGGYCGKIADLKQNMMDVAESYIPWFQEQEGLKSDESKRNGRAPRGDMFGIEGSFRKLEID